MEISFTGQLPPTPIQFHFLSLGNFILIDGARMFFLERQDVSFKDVKAILPFR